MGGSGGGLSLLAGGAGLERGGVHAGFREQEQARGHQELSGGVRTERGVVLDGPVGAVRGSHGSGQPQRNGKVFDGAEPGDLWGLGPRDEVLVRPPATSMAFSDFVRLLREEGIKETFYLEYLALHQYLGDALAVRASGPL
ncbi:unnamed protein product, partial [Hapterophycus canaliculatus]